MIAAALAFPGIGFATGDTDRRVEACAAVVFVTCSSQMTQGGAVVVATASICKRRRTAVGSIVMGNPDDWEGKEKDHVERQAEWGDDLWSSSRGRRWARVCRGDDRESHVID